ncbi:hypothetical protein ACN38_g10952 [Penicillium nordicum]|uniref:Uncharacterized protein n=1 Tax=Penicillium nordicum TaxID=229535 RepID=A0A0N0RXR0_9EURO|nr:hypothetical protein ACN38_g10952 [Penicillium nordicum]
MRYEDCPRNHGSAAPLGTDPLCAVDSLSLSPSLLLLSVQPQAENFTVLFLQSQPRRFSVRFFTAHNIPLQKIANRLRPNRGPPLCPTIPTPPDLILFALITFKQQHKYGRVHKTPTGWLVALSGPSFGRDNYLSMVLTTMETSAEKFQQHDESLLILRIQNRIITSFALSPNQSRSQAPPVHQNYLL